MILDLTQHRSNALQQPDINNDICFSRQSNTGLLSQDADAVRAGLLPPVSLYRCCMGCDVASCLTTQMLYGLRYCLLSQDTDAVQVAF